jgi:hypothetical protein
LSADVEPVRDTATQRQIAWRRGKVAELDAQGYTQHAIADIMKVAVSTINSDLQWLRQRAAESIKSYTQEKLPHLFDRSLLGLTQVLNEAWKTSNSTKYERNRILALSLVKDTITARLDLASNADIIDKTVPLKMLKYFVDHPEEAREKLEILCRRHQMVKKFEFREFQRDNR